MKLAPFYFYMCNLFTHLILSIPFWFILPKVNYILLFTFLVISLFASTKDGEQLFNSDDTSVDGFD